MWFCWERPFSRQTATKFTRRRAEWFDRVPSPYVVLWWVPEGERPPIERGLARLKFLQKHGSGPKAFDPLHQFDSTGQPVRRRRGAERR